MFRVTVTDLSNNEVLSDDIFEHVEVTESTGIFELPPKPSGDIELTEVGTSTALIKAWTGEAAGMQVFEDFVNLANAAGPIPVS